MTRVSATARRVSGGRDVPVEHHAHPDRPLGGEVERGLGVAAPCPGRDLGRVVAVRRGDLEIDLAPGEDPLGGAVPGVEPGQGPEHLEPGHQMAQFRGGVLDGGAPRQRLHAAQRHPGADPADRHPRFLLAPRQFPGAFALALEGHRDVV